MLEGSFGPVFRMFLVCTGRVVYKILIGLFPVAFPNSCWHKFIVLPGLNFEAYLLQIVACCITWFWLGKDFRPALKSLLLHLSQS